jgi:signal transduction histidine kinase
MRASDLSKKGKILVVDDAMENVRILHHALMDEHEVVFALDGKKGLEIARAQSPDLILLDAVMPGIDGYAVCAELKKSTQTRNIPVIFVTTLNGPEDETRALDAGAVDFITKPVNGAVVRTRVRTHLTLKRQSDLLRQLSDHQQNIKELERKRIAQDVHDNLGQNLLALKMDIGTLFKRADDTDPRLKKRVQIILNNIDGTIKSVMNDLRPATLELGLHPAIEWQLQQFQRISGIRCKLVTAEPELGFRLDEDRTAAVFRIVQELLSNVARHAAATEVEIALNQDERGFSMKITDNGNGLQPGDRKKAKTFGLIGIAERIHSLGGELVIAGGPDHGTALSISIPDPD